MKKVSLFALVLFLIFIFVGCGNKNNIDNQEDKSSEHIHNYGTLIERVAPGCETEGVKEHYVCAECGKVFDSNKNETTIDDLKIQPLNHDYSSSWNIEGDKHYHACSRCDSHSDEAKHALVHHEKIDATHTENGVCEYYECSICKALFKDEDCKNRIDSPIIIEALGHDKVLILHERVDPSCEEKGTEAYYTCSCGAMFSDSNGENQISEIVEIAALGHQNVIHHTKVDASCTEDGNIEYYECGVCHKTYNDANCKNEIQSTVINALGHQNIIHHERHDASCTEAGNVEYYECEVCHKTYSDANCTNEIQTTVINALGHQNIIHHERHDASCTENGNVEYYECGVCHKTYSDANCTTEIQTTVINALGHQNVIHHEKVEPKCLDNGCDEYYECGVCHKLFSDSNCTTEIQAPEVLLATGHQHISHIIGECSTVENTSGHIDHYKCDDCGTKWLDEERTTTIEDVSIPYSEYRYLNVDTPLVPYYDETHSVVFSNALEAGKTISLRIYGPKITNLDAKTISFYIKNASTYSIAVRIFNATGGALYQTLTPTSSNGWQKVTLTIDQFNSQANEGNYGFIVSVGAGSEGEGSFYLSRVELNYTSAEDIAAADALLENLEVVDDISNYSYIETFMESLPVIEQIHQILGSSIPSSLQYRDKLIKYYDYYENNKILYDAREKLFAIDAMSSSYISGISRITQDNMTLCKVMVSQDTNTILCKVPDFVNSVRLSSYAIFRVYNPTSNKVVLNIYDGSQLGTIINSVNVYANSWETVMIDTSLFTQGKSMFVRLTGDGESSVKGDWLFTSIVHYSGNKRIVYGQGNSQKMTIYKANWIEAPRGEYETRTAFDANLVGPTTDSLAAVSIERIDANIYDHVELYIYNDTEYDLTMKTHMDGNNTYCNFEQVIEKGKWTKLEISVEVWNENYSRTTRYYEFYPLNSGDKVIGKLYFSYVYGVLK